VREEDFRLLLDDYGVLRPGVLEAPAPSRAFRVFAQRRDARVEAEVWRRHAEQFFDTDLRVNVPKNYVFDAPASDAALVSLTTTTRPEATRLCYGRPRESDDLRAADEADTRQGSAGLGLLAARCSQIWLIAREEEQEEGKDDGDEAALRLAAILASVVLGPILSPEGELFGVRTARGKLEAMGGPYR
jgi:hypothetical protein